MLQKNALPPSSEKFVWLTDCNDWCGTVGSTPVLIWLRLRKLDPQIVWSVPEAATITASPSQLKVSGYSSDILIATNFSIFNTHNIPMHCIYYFLHTILGTGNHYFSNPPRRFDLCKGEVICFHEVRTESICVYRNFTLQMVRILLQAIKI